jgi:hypothetical protein
LRHEHADADPDLTAEFLKEAEYFDRGGDDPA